MDNQKNWYIKLEENFFKCNEIKLLQSMDNGKDYVILLLKLRLLTINTKGLLQYNDVIPYNDKMIAELTDTNIDVVRSALAIFQKLGLASLTAENVIHINDVERLIGYVSREAEKKAKYREKKKLIALNEGTTERTNSQTKKGTLSDNSIEYIVNSKEYIDNSNNNSNIYDYYCRKINPNAPVMVAQTLNSYLVDGMTYEVLKEIIDYCLAENKISWSYVKSVVNNNFNDGVRTIDDFKRVRAEFLNKKQNKGTSQIGNNKPSREELLESAKKYEGLY